MKLNEKVEKQRNVAEELTWLTWKSNNHTSICALGPFSNNLLTREILHGSSLSLLYNFEEFSLYLGDFAGAIF